MNIDWAWLHSFLNVLGNASTLSALVYLTMSAAGLVFLCAHRVEWCLISHTTAAEDLKNQVRECDHCGSTLNPPWSLLVLLLLL